MRYWLLEGDCAQVLRAQAPDDSVDAIITDPPYGLRFMSKAWDYTLPSVETFAELFRVLKPGGRLLCFAGTRTFHRMWCNIEDAGFTIEDSIAWMYGSGFPKHRSKLKPAYEPICVARKGPVSELNIDECRIEGEPWKAHRATGLASVKFFTSGEAKEIDKEPHALGRWPANVMLDEEAARLLDEQSGTLTSGAGNIKRRSSKSRDGNTGAAYGAENRPEGSEMISYGDSGGASRFFYVAKASRSERNAGLDGMPKRSGGSNAKGFTADVANGQDRNRPTENHHPTVKPIVLMRELVKLITPEGGTVLDPFCGSGTTGTACMMEGREFIGIDLSAEYLAIAERRIAHAMEKVRA